MFIILYRWRVKPEKEAQFIEAWSEITVYYHEKYASLGSRLHRGNDGIFYAYAQWNFAEQREKAFLDASKSEAGAKIRDAVAECFPEVQLEIVADYLVGQKN